MLCRSRLLPQPSPRFLASSPACARKIYYCKCSTVPKYLKHVRAAYAGMHPQRKASFSVEATFARTNTGLTFSNISTNAGMIPHFISVRVRVTRKTTPQPLRKKTSIFSRRRGGGAMQCLRNTLDDIFLKPYFSWNFRGIFVRAPTPPPRVLDQTSLEFRSR